MLQKGKLRAKTPLPAPSQHEPTPTSHLTFSFIVDQVVSDRWLQQGDYGYARTATAGGTPTSARMPSPGSFPMGRTSGVNMPHAGAGAIAGIGGDYGNGGGGGGAAPRGHPAPGAGGGGGGLGLRPQPSLSFLPLTQQGYRAIKVSDDEVHKSINQGTTTGGNAGSGPGCGAPAAAAARGGGSSPAQQRCWPSAGVCCF